MRSEAEIRAEIRAYELFRTKINLAVGKDMLTKVDAKIEQLWWVLGENK